MNKPGCFASPSVFSHDSGFCRACPAFTECSTASLATLQRIRATVDVDKLIRKHKVARSKIELERVKDKAELVAATPVLSATGIVDKVRNDLLPEDQAAIASITNAKTAAVATTLCHLGRFVDARADLAAGKNPLAGMSGATNVRVAIDMLIAGGFTQKELVKRYTEPPIGWQKGTAESQASMALSIVTAFELAEAVEGRFVIKGTK